MKNIKAGDKVTINYCGDTITATLLPNGASLTDRGLIFYVMLDDHSMVGVPVENICDTEFIEIYDEIYEILIGDRRDHFLFRTQNGYKGASEKVLNMLANKYYRRNV